jgi:hypothetical protein
MPSVLLDLGEFVRVRGPRKDGTYRVLFEVPENRRPSGWSATWPLPLLDRRGDLTDADEVARIQRDAKILLAELHAARNGRPALPPGRTLEMLIADWQDTEEYRATKPRTQKGYDQTAAVIADWSASNGRPDPTTLTEQACRAFLKLYDDRPWMKWHLRKVLRMIMARAVALKWRADNPVEGIRIKMPKSTVSIWEASDVALYARAAVEIGQPGLAALIRTQWEIGQRLTDAILWRVEADFRPVEGVFRFWQSKTGEYVTIPVSAACRASIAAAAIEGSLYLFNDACRTPGPYVDGRRTFAVQHKPFADVDRLGHVFEDVRAKALEIDPTARALTLRAIRHSCVVQLARSACTVPEIASITGHSISSVETILSTYLPRDNEVAWNAQRKRGLIEG